MLINKANLSALTVAITANYIKGLNLVSPQYKLLTTRIPSNTTKSQHNWLGKATHMRQWLGDRVVQSMGTHGFEIENKDFELTLGVDRNDIADDTYGLYGPLAQEMGQSVALHPDELLTQVIVAGGTGLGYDGVPFFSASHPYDPGATDPITGASLSGQVQSNQDMGGSGPTWYLMTLSNPIKPFIFQDRQKPQFVSKTSLTDDNVFNAKQFLYGVDARYNVGYGLWQLAYRSNQALDEEHFEDAMNAFSGLRAPNGKPAILPPTHLVVPTSLGIAARRLLNSTVVLSTNNEGGAAVDNIFRGVVTPLEMPYLPRS